jgi:hypothetical protein
LTARPARISIGDERFEDGLGVRGASEQPEVLEEHA